MPKRTEREDRNKDRARATWIARGGLLAAVADGATQGYRSEAWAESLVQAWVVGGMAGKRSNEALERQIDALAAAWRAGSSPSAQAPWYVSAKAARGAHSTFLGLRISRSGRGWRWSALAVGDTELFVLDGYGGCPVRYPLKVASEFTARPPLISTLANPDLRPGRTLRREGPLPRGGWLLVATDALAKYLLSADEAGMPAWLDARRAATSHSAFRGWIANLRAAGKLDDDDTTLVAVERTR